MYTSYLTGASDKDILTVLQHLQFLFWVVPIIGDTYWY